MEMGLRTRVISRRSNKYLKKALFNQLFKKGISPSSVWQQLDGFLKSRKRVFKWEVGVSVRKLRAHGRFSSALKLSENMARRGMNPTVSDVAIRLDLIAKTRGISTAEEYFIHLPEPSKNHLTYGALLNCYCKELQVEKAEGLMEKMKELRFASSPMAYNSLMTLYTKTNQTGKVSGVIQEMKANDVMPDCFTYNVWMRSLAAVNDIPGVERVIEEMKRDGRVDADWTTYSNLASIYVDAGMFQKAEVAMKELENRIALHDGNVPYQFLITLYGRTGNLEEVYRIWRALKQARSRMANVSYLNMIQVLVNLKDLPGAEACFKEWENKCKYYDIRVANALIKAYLDEGMLDKAEATKKQAKLRGGRLNAKSWKLFMDYYMKNGDMKMAHWCADRAIKKGRSLGRIWVPPSDAVSAIMAYFVEKKDAVTAEKFVELLQNVQKEIGTEVFEALVRVYAAAGKKSPGIRRRLKMENVVVSEETEKLLEEICVE